MKEENGGYYLCWAENSVGQTRAFVLLSVQRKEEGNNEDEERARYERQREEQEREMERRRQEEEQQRQLEEQQRQREEQEREREREQYERDQREREEQEIENKAPDVPAPEPEQPEEKGDKPLVYIRGEVTGRIQPGSALKLVCLATGVPKGQEENVRFISATGAQNIEMSREVTGKVVKVELRFNQFDPEAHAGFYRCSASNQYGTSIDDASLTKEHDTSYSLSTQNFQREENPAPNQPKVELNTLGDLQSSNQVEIEASLKNCKLLFNYKNII